MKIKFFQITSFLITALLLIFFFTSCEETSTGLAEYQGTTVLSRVTAEANYKPKVNWLGGYVSVLGVNRGTGAALDTSLVWLIKTNGDNIHYKPQFGVLPEGATDITSQFGGVKLDSLAEDEVYTFWVMKADVWEQVSQHPNSIIKVDSTLTSSFVVSGDSVKVNPYSFASGIQSLDVYVNITELTQFGRLGQVTVSPTYSNKPVISWVITESGVTDTLLSAMGVVEGQQYVAEFALWDIYSESTDSVGNPEYGRLNIIPGPIQAGENVQGTHVFASMPETGLERGKTYYVWIANNKWNRSSRTRTTSGYAWATFTAK